MASSCLPVCAVAEAPTTDSRPDKGPDKGPDKTSRAGYNDR